MTTESTFKFSKFSECSFKVSIDGIENFNSFIFSSLSRFHISMASSQDFIHHTFASINSTLVYKVVFFRGSHLGEHSDKWSNLFHHSSLGTDLDHYHSLGRELKKWSFTSNHFIKEVKSIFNNGNSILTFGHVFNKSLMFSSSNGSDLIFGRLGIKYIFFAVSKINFSSVKRSRTCVVVFLSSFERFITIFDFLSSEDFFFFTVGWLDCPHRVMFSLFGSDLFVEFLDRV